MYGYFFGKLDNLEKFIKKEIVGFVKLDWIFVRFRVFEKLFINFSYVKKLYKYVYSIFFYLGVFLE